MTHNHCPRLVPSCESCGHTQKITPLSRCIHLFPREYQRHKSPLNQDIFLLRSTLRPSRAKGVGLDISCFPCLFQGIVFSSMPSMEVEQHSQPDWMFSHSGNYRYALHKHRALALFALSARLSGVGIESQLVISQLSLIFLCIAPVIYTVGIEMPFPFTQIGQPFMTAIIHYASAQPIS